MCINNIFDMQRIASPYKLELEPDIANNLTEQTHLLIDSLLEKVSISQFICRQNINSGLVKNKIWFDFVEEIRQMLAKQLQI